MIYVGMENYDDEQRAIRVDDIYSMIRKIVPKTFKITDRPAHDGHTYEVFMENDHCEVVVQDEGDYVAVAFIAKEKAKGWYMTWKRTALRVFEKFHDAEFDLSYRTSAWTSSKWTPKEYHFCGKKFRGIDAHRS
jgi:hypothetical protein